MNPAVRTYWSQYKWSNVFAMFSNMKQQVRTYPEPLPGKLVVITGATAGVGYYTVRKYAAMGARILMINRNPEKSERVCREITEAYNTEIAYITADLTSLEDIQRTGQFLLSLGKKIDVLIHNAGVHLKSRTDTPDGLEVNFVIHYLAPLMITRMLIPKFQQDGAGRVIFVSSEAYRFAVWGLDVDDLQWNRRRYTGIKAYGAGKLAQILSMHILAGELAPYHVTVNAMHPGMVRTESGKDNGRVYQWYKKHIVDRLSASPEVSAEALYYLGVSSEVECTCDVFFHLTQQEDLTPPARDVQAAEDLWKRTEALLEKKGISL